MAWFKKGTADQARAAIDSKFLVRNGHTIFILAKPGDTEAKRQKTG